MELGKKYHMGQRRAKRYAESPEKSEYTLSEPKPTKMDLFKAVVGEWLEEALYSAKRILDKVYVSSRKMELNEKAAVRFETMSRKQENFTLNLRFEDFVGFYGFKPILCQPHRGQMKGEGREDSTV